MTADDWDLPEPPEEPTSRWHKLWAYSWGSSSGTCLLLALTLLQVLREPLLCSSLAFAGLALRQWYLCTTCTKVKNCGMHDGDVWEAP